jgi:hypothetical protein
MKFEDFKRLVEFNTQDNQGKLPTSHKAWSEVIKASILQMRNSTFIGSHVNQEEITQITNDESILTIEEELTHAVVYDVSALFSKEVVMKQLMFSNRDDVMSNFIHNLFKKGRNE